ncbi:M28 family metallopeptidase [Gluconobacter sphaericus]|uniref:Peptidase n=1 Tax=Gluconobacter sphaericus NBRC 12467 TaxID=1307951 RepID=A0AA37SKH0_9PROT|nr:M28 family metallopeptidase [Gluconobacter sphaericus]MBF0886392.1 M20/M25/M40 family metallo-hydrolase [Gluconobacter sphaericus]MBS1086451.1 M20/M25/M40 family metallo-hydrolase [Gluconobacter sphaericus]MBS1100439.1 M20/M25/M40 family metallo-hydrolase [Gluconobacter sphaericus]GEB43261.1 peptidase [Gluconobacter sphaericus NBRC 12467]GLQ86173.1 peptidase [Gluconobacter sphaericus NBRC 12467]
MIQKTFPRRSLFLATALTAVLLAPVTGHADPTAEISPSRMSETMKILASDRFEGRAPGTAGEKVTVPWLIEQYKALGLEPAGENGGWTQTVPMIRTRTAANGSISVRSGGRALPLIQLQDIYLSTLLPEDRLQVKNAPMVFVGYGVHAPERHWDDFKGVDLKGKVAVFLVNDPDFDADPGEPVAGRFGGKTMTYYGRWTYKYEEAARRGAVAALIVHDTAAASYPWSTVVAPGGEAYDVEHTATESRPVPVQGWLEGKAAAALFRQAGLDLDALRIKARSENFHPVTLKRTTFSADLPVTVDRLQSQNVLAKITGAKYPDETVMFGAHWDAYGKSTDAQGNTVIRRGAIDDGSGIAALFEIARAFKAGPQPHRTIRFAAWTGEERGLLGSGWYVAHPLAPLDKTAANLTMDVLQMAGPAHNAFIIGAGQDTLQEQFAAAVALQGRTAQPEAMPERGAFYRADHLPFARAGVPVLAVMDMAGKFDLLKGGTEAGGKWLTAYMACYHQACDAWSPDWDVRGAAQDVWAVWKVGHDVAFSHDWPQWKVGSEFAAIREKTAPATVQ